MGGKNSGREKFRIPEFLKSKGFSATYMAKNIEEDMAILGGKFNFLFSSPEKLLGVSKWRDMLVSSSSIRLVVVDEAHTVLQWKVPFIMALLNMSITTVSEDAHLL